MIEMECVEIDFEFNPAAFMHGNRQCVSRDEMSQGVHFVTKQLGETNAKNDR
jgi:hypothetical protein